MGTKCVVMYLTTMIADDENTSVADSQKISENIEADCDSAVDVKPDYV